MTTHTFREEVLNVLLAELLEGRGLVSVPETVVKSLLSTGGKRLPDVTIADLRGVRIVIEGRFESSASQVERLTELAASRVEDGIAPVCLAVLYPTALKRAASLSDARKALSRATLKARVISEGATGTWGETDVGGLAEILRASYELLVAEEVVVSAVMELAASLEQSSRDIASSPAVAQRLRALLGIPEDQGASSEDEDE